MIRRDLSLDDSYSFFLFGARGVGKTTFLHQRFSDKPHVYIDLLNPETLDRYTSQPSLFRQRLLSLPEDLWVVVDEIQKIPALLDSVHELIERHRMRFALTGSSARKLRYGAANLLAGRAFVYSLYPLTHRELGNRFDLYDILQWGSLPQILQFDQNDSKREFLNAYAHTYLREEVWAEHLIRKLPPFQRFLELAALSNGSIVNYLKLASEIGVDSKTLQTYFEILEDTLVGMLLPPYSKSLRKRQRKNPKFYFFDLGVKRALERTLTVPIVEKTQAYGHAFEHFIVIELHRLISYARNDFRLSYLRTKDDAEVDLVVERPGQKTVFIEIKSSVRVTERDVATLRRFQREFRDEIECVCLSNDTEEHIIDGVRAVHWRDGIHYLGV